MEILKLGSSGPWVEFLQSTLKKAGFYPGPINGNYDDATRIAVIDFQKRYNLIPDGIVGASTWNALYPFMAGYDTYTVRSGDTIYQIAANYGTTMNRILTANPGINAAALQVGQKILVPFTNIVPTNVSYTYAIMEMNLYSLKRVYPFLEIGSIGNSVMGNRLYYCKIGNGKTEVFYNASFHANEWITTPLLMKYIENFARAYTNRQNIYGYDAREIFRNVTVYIVPMVNPDGVNLVTGGLPSDTAAYKNAQRIGENYPAIPFPDGWKANIEGIDLNLQFPANWESAKEIKANQGYTSPAPRDYVGPAPLSAPESRAIHSFTLAHDFSLILAYHTQGQVIYWRYLDYNPDKAYYIGQQFAAASGYELEETPYASGFAGYKDWFIQEYNRPGYTIEVGHGNNPLPISQFDEIYADNEGILVLGSVLIL